MTLFVKEHVFGVQLGMQGAHLSSSLGLETPSPLTYPSCQEVAPGGGWRDEAWYPAGKQLNMLGKYRVDPERLGWDKRPLG